MLNQRETPNSSDTRWWLIIFVKGSVVTFTLWKKNTVQGFDQRVLNFVLPLKGFT